MRYFDFTILANLLMFRNKRLSYSNSETLCLNLSQNPLKLKFFQNAKLKTATVQAYLFICDGSSKNIENC